MGVGYFTGPIGLLEQHHAASFAVLGLYELTSLYEIYDPFSRNNSALNLIAAMQNFQNKSGSITRDLQFKWRAGDAAEGRCWRLRGENWREWKGWNGAVEKEGGGVEWLNMLSPFSKSYRPSYFTAK